MNTETAAVALGISKASLVILEQGRRRSSPRLVLVGRIAELIGLDRREAALLAGWSTTDVDAVYGSPAEFRAA